MECCVSPADPSLAWHLMVYFKAKHSPSGVKKGKCINCFTEPGRDKVGSCHKEISGSVLALSWSLRHPEQANTSQPGAEVNEALPSSHPPLSSHAGPMEYQWRTVGNSTEPRVPSEILLRQDTSCYQEVREEMRTGHGISR